MVRENAQLTIPTHVEQKRDASQPLLFFLTEEKRQA